VPYREAKRRLERCAKKCARASETVARPVAGGVLARHATERGALGVTTHRLRGFTEEARWLDWLRAVPRFHRDRRHPSSPGRGRDRCCDDDDKEPYPCHDRGTNACSAGRDREGGREGNRWLDDSRGCSFPGLRGGLDDPQKDHPDPRESLQNMDSLLQARRIPCFRLLSRRQLALAQQRERQDPGDLAVERPPRALVRILNASGHEEVSLAKLPGSSLRGAGCGTYDDTLLATSLARLDLPHKLAHMPVQPIDSLSKTPALIAVAHSEVERRSK
jgi:hypothetical protein